jgi:CRISPR-associated endonuclease/helicase Cas3
MISGMSPMVEINTDLRGLLREVASLEAHDFQIDAARRLLEGENLVLVSPTGSGKSWAALLAFIYARRHGIPFADRLIYAFPLRTLTTALYQQYGEYLQQEGLEATLQMGGMKRGEGDPFFEGDVIFTTIDQLLSGYIGVPVSLPRRLANMPAGALIGSCVVFDEFHLLEPDKALATTLDLAEQLEPYAQTLLMSATFSGDGIDEIRRRAHAGKREVSPGELEYPNRRETRRKFVWSGREPSASAVLDAHHERTIVVCNTVDRATSLYSEIVSLAEDRGIEDRILLLHARFLPEDRKVKEKELLKLFGEKSKERAILVATQVVEVGLDISADVFHTEVAPASAIFQRAGRCARFGGETAEKELKAISTRRETLENLERDKDALLEYYARMTPAALDALSPEERHQVYKMLRLAVEISPDGSLDCSGVLEDSFVSENEDERVLLAHDQVDLPAPCPVVALDECVAVLDQVAQREVFTPRPGGFVLQSPTPA